MTYNCNTVAVGQTLSSWQELGLKLVSRIYGGRDVIFAIDLTDSVGLNDEGRIRLTQIIQDSLHSGDTVYVVPFASEVNPLALEVNPLATGIKFRGKKQDIAKILATVPFESNISLSNTDIQKAEAYIYPGLAQLNQCRLAALKGIKPQSVVWLTDAPLLTPQGITSDIWIETPASSPFRVADSPESVARANWIQALGLKERSIQIEGSNSRQYQLTVVDLNPQVQEFCTPIPGGKETCLVNSYLLKMLWLPTAIFFSIIVGSSISIKYLISLNKKWKLKISFTSDDTREQQIFYLKNQQKILIGEDNIKSIFCPDNQMRGYLIRKGNSLYLNATETVPIYLSNRKITKRQKITTDYLTLNCPVAGKNFEIVIKIIKY